MLFPTHATRTGVLMKGQELGEEMGKGVPGRGNSTRKGGWPWGAREGFSEGSCVQIQMLQRSP